MSTDWEEQLQPHPYDDGRFQAARLFGRPTPVLRHTLELATANRERLAMRPFKGRERQFLAGFLEAIREELDRRAETGEEPPDPYAEATETARAEFDERRRRFEAEALPAPPVLALPSPTRAIPPVLESKPVLDLPLPTGAPWAGPDPLYAPEPASDEVAPASLTRRSNPGEADPALPPPVLNWTALDTLYGSLAADEPARRQGLDREPPPEPDPDRPLPDFVFTGFPEETGMGRPLPPPPSAGAERSGVAAPEFLFAGVPKGGRKRSGRDDRSVSRDRPTGPEFLFTGVPEAARSQRPRPPREPGTDATPPPPETPRLDPGLLVAPEDPPLRLRQRLTVAWRAVCARLEYTPPNEWEP